MPDLKNHSAVLVVRCPGCSLRFRLNTERLRGKRLTLKCRRCGEVFVQHVVSAPSGDTTMVLIAHSDVEAAAGLRRGLDALRLPHRWCRNGEELLGVLATEQPAVVLLDVALPGLALHAGIEAIRRSAVPGPGIVLVASVFRPGAYFRPPVDLHGADGWLDPNRMETDLEARIRPLLERREVPLSPSLGADDGPTADPLPKEDGETVELARVIAADIMLFHRDRLDEAIRLDSVVETFADEIGEGEALLQRRLGTRSPKAAGQVREAFLRLVQQRAAELTTP